MIIMCMTLRVTTLDSGVRCCMSCVHDVACDATLDSGVRCCMNTKNRPISLQEAHTNAQRREVNSCVSPIATHMKKRGTRERDTRGTGEKGKARTAGQDATEDGNVVLKRYPLKYYAMEGRSEMPT